MESSDSGRVFDDDIPDFVRRACGNYLVEYCGEYRTQGKLWDVYELESNLVNLFKDEGLQPLMGYPLYLLLAKDGSGHAMLCKLLTKSSRSLMQWRSRLSNYARKVTSVALSSSGSKPSI